MPLSSRVTKLTARSNRNLFLRSVYLFCCALQFISVSVFLSNTDQVPFSSTDVLSLIFGNVFPFPTSVLHSYTHIHRGASVSNPCSLPPSAAARGLAQDLDTQAYLLFIYVIISQLRCRMLMCLCP